MSMEYLDFELQIEATATPGQYAVSIVASPAGETPRPQYIPFPFEAGEVEKLHEQLENALLRSRVRTRKALTPEEKAVRVFGGKLFDSIFSGEARNLYYESRLQAGHAGRGLRLKLRAQPPEFAHLPWEFLLEPRRDEFICLSVETPIVRYPELPQPTEPWRVDGPLRILGMVAHPLGWPELDAAQEQQRIEQALAAARKRGAAIELRWLEGQTAAALQRALRPSETWHIFHFIGHGSFETPRDEGVLWLADDRGRAHPLGARQLARLLGDHRPLRLAVLNACEGARGGELDVFSSTAATLVRSGLPAVLAMQYEISDRAAILTAEWFYESLADSLPVDAAVAEARKAISLDNDRSLEWGTPVLFMRAPDGRIFDVTPSPEPAKAAPVVNPLPEPTKPDPTPAPRTQALAAPAAKIAIPHIVTGAAPLQMAWCWVPRGEFTMGSQYKDDEKPAHKVHVDGFWLARAPVTNAQYRRFIEAGGYDQTRWWTEAGWQQRQAAKWSQPGYWDDSKWNGAQQPVVGVSWYEAAAFCDWAAEATGAAIHLPTEAEWEKGARGVDDRIYPWGAAEPDQRLANFSGMIGKTTPVGRYSPQGDSPYGCADMAGNVWEWCASKLVAYPYQVGDGRNNITGTDVRVLRGGAWHDSRNLVRCAYRIGGDPRYRYYDVGFRCASTAF